MSTRLEKSKFRYPVEHGAAFVELRDDTMSGEKVFQILAAPRRAPNAVRTSSAAYKDANCDAVVSTDQSSPPGTQRQIAQALPGNLVKLNRAKRDSERRKTPQAKADFAVNLVKLNRAKRDSERRKTPQAKADFAVRTSSAAYKDAKKRWNTQYRATAKAKTAAAGRNSSDAYKAAKKKWNSTYNATAKAKTAAAGRKSSAAYKSAKKISDSKRRAIAKTKAAKRVSDSYSGQPISDAPGPFA
jgi:hypothetical protein